LPNVGAEVVWLERGEAMDNDVAKCRWERAQALLGLARDTPDRDFARGGLASLAVEPTVRIIVLPGDPSFQAVPAEEPTTVVPKVITLPDGRQFPAHGAVRGTSSGYVGYTAGDGSRWQNFAAVHWHGGVDFFLGGEGGRDWEYASSRGRVFFLQKCVGRAWAAFDLQRRIAERFEIPGPFRAILAIADTTGAALGYLGAGWPDPGSVSLFGQPTAIEPRVLLLEDLDEWPDEKGVKELALRFGARVDLVFGGPGERHLDHAGPETGRFNPRW
jgi:hypothetical protein